MKHLVFALAALVLPACLSVQPAPVVNCCESCGSSGGGATPSPSDPDPDPIDPCPPCKYVMSSAVLVGTLATTSSVKFPIKQGELKLLWTDSSGNSQSGTFVLKAYAGTPETDVDQLVTGAPTKQVSKAWIRWQGSTGVWTGPFEKKVVTE